MSGLFDVLFIILSLALAWRTTRNLALSYVECLTAGTVGYPEPERDRRWKSHSKFAQETQDWKNANFFGKCMLGIYGCVVLGNVLSWVLACLTIGSLLFDWSGVAIQDGVRTLVLSLIVYLVGVCIHAFARAYRSAIVQCDLACRFNPHRERVDELLAHVNRFQQSRDRDRQRNGQGRSRDEEEDEEEDYDEKNVSRTANTLRLDGRADTARINSLYRMVVGVLVLQVITLIDVMRHDLGEDIARVVVSGCNALTAVMGRIVHLPDVGPLGYVLAFVVTLGLGRWIFRRVLRIHAWNMCAGAIYSGARVPQW